MAVASKRRAWWCDGSVVCRVRLVMRLVPASLDSGWGCGSQRSSRAHPNSLFARLLRPATPLSADFAVCGGIMDQSSRSRADVRVHNSPGSPDIFSAVGNQTQEVIRYGPPERPNTS
jgi:hypothetical protein